MILRELLAGSEHFNEIHRGVPLMSRALLARRLRQLEETGVIAKVRITGERGHHYTLTPAGQESPRAGSARTLGPALDRAGAATQPRCRLSHVERSPPYRPRATT